jgi:ADP-heptose:LPS heptosyltransferase
LGDSILALPFLAALSDHFQGLGLNLAGSPPFLELFAHLPWVDLILDHNRAEWAGLYLDPPQIPEVFKSFLLSHQLAVVLSRGADDPLAAGLKALGLPQVLLVPSRPPDNRPIHLTDHMFEAAGLAPPPDRLLLHPGPAALARAENLAVDLDLKPGAWVVLHPGSGSPVKNWGVDHWLELGRTILESRGLTPVYLLGPAEDHLADLVQAEASAFGGRVVRGLPLSTAAGLLFLGQGCLGHDSGLSHLAARLGRPTVAVFGPTDPAQWAPRGPLVKVVAPPDQVLTSDWSWLKPRLILEAFDGLRDG